MQFDKLRVDPGDGAKRPVRHDCVRSGQAQHRHARFLLGVMIVAEVMRLRRSALA